MRSGRAGPYFSMWKSMQKTFKGRIPLKIPCQGTCNGGSCRYAPRRTVLAVALAVREIFCNEFLSLLAMNSGASRVHCGSASNFTPREQAIWSARRLRAPSPAAQGKGESNGGTPLAAFASFSAAKRKGLSGLRTLAIIKINNNELISNQSYDFHL